MVHPNKGQAEKSRQAKLRAVGGPIRSDDDGDPDEPIPGLAEELSKRERQYWAPAAGTDMEVEQRERDENSAFREPNDFRRRKRRS